MSLFMSQSVDSLDNGIRSCKKCPLHKKRTHAVPGEGSSSASLFFIGEAPGRNEDEQGRPFIGRSGKLLTELLKSINRDRTDVYITSMVKCRPPKNRKPKNTEITTCKRLWLDQQIHMVQPSIIVLLGGVATSCMIDETTLKNIHGTIQEKNNQQFFVTYHPAAGLRNPATKKKLFKDFQRLKTLIS